MLGCESQASRLEEESSILSTTIPANRNFDPSLNQPQQPDLSGSKESDWKVTLARLKEDHKKRAEMEKQKNKEWEQTLEQFFPRVKPSDPIIPPVSLVHAPAPVVQATSNSESDWKETLARLREEHKKRMEMEQPPVQSVRRLPLKLKDVKPKR